MEEVLQEYIITNHIIGKTEDFPLPKLDIILKI